MEETKFVEMCFQLICVVSLSCQGLTVEVVFAIIPLICQSTSDNGLHLRTNTLGGKCEFIFSTRYWLNNRNPIGKNPCYSQNMLNVVNVILICKLLLQNSNYLSVINKSERVDEQ